MLETVTEVLLGTAVVVLLGIVALAAWPWRVEATLKAATRASAVSVAAGLSLAGVSASAAAIVGGPGVIAVHFRAREMWRRPIANVTVEAALIWLDELLARPAAPEKSFISRLVQRTKAWLLPRTDMADLPELGVRVLGGLRDVALRGAFTCGFSDPALTGKTAAWLYPLAGVLSPLGAFDVSIDWSGKTVVDGDVEVSVRIVPARVAFEGLRFARHHVHPLRKPVRA